MAVNLNDLREEGILESMIVIELASDDYTDQELIVDLDNVVLMTGHNGDTPEGKYDFGNEVYIFTKSQASQLSRRDIHLAKTFKVSRVGEAKYTPLAMGGNPSFFI